uniref:Uncharacterized protein n=1 Tax=Chenopodium quinoa TaxID=63459 RepID=A0A803M8A2_CHEQI
MVIDLSQGLVPGCFIPVSDEKVARRRHRQQLTAREQDGFRVLYGPTDQPYYTNLVFYSGAEEDDDSDNQGEVDFAPNVSLSPRRHYGLAEDPYAQFYPTQNGGMRHQGERQGASQDVSMAQAISPQISEGRPRSWKAQAGLSQVSRELLTRLVGRLPPPSRPSFMNSTFEVGESSNAANRPSIERGNLFRTLGIVEWATTPFQQLSTNVQSGRRLVHSVTGGRASSWFHPDAIPDFSLFFGDGPPNVQEAGFDLRILRHLRSVDDDSVRERSFDPDWVQRKKRQALDRWQWGVQVRSPRLVRAVGKKRMDSTSSSAESGSPKIKKSEVTSTPRDVIDDMDIEQRLKERWVREGDLATPMLYNRVKQRRKRMEIITLKRDDAVWVSGHDNIADLTQGSLKSFYSEN